MGQFLPQVAFRWFKPDNTPAFGYTAAFYGAGLSPIFANLKDVYDETSTVVPIPNPVPFDVEGKCVVVLGAGGYKLVIRDELLATVFTKDNIFGTGTGLNTGFVTNIADLRALTSMDPPFVYVSGYYNSDDGGNGMFYWDPVSALSDDTGYVIIPNSLPIIGRWLRIEDDNGDVRAAAYGYIASTPGVQTAAMQAANVQAAITNRRLRIGIGGSAEIGAMVFTAPRVIFEGSLLTGTVVVPVISFLGTIEAPTLQIFSNMTALLSLQQERAKPEWFGASAIIPDNLIPLNALFASQAYSYELANANYVVSASPTLPAMGTIHSSGLISFGAVLIVQQGIYVIGSNGLVRSINGQFDLIYDDLTVQNNVTAGSEVGFPGILSQRIGTGLTSGSPAVSTQSTSVTPVTAPGGAEGNLISTTLLANSLLADGDSVRVRAGGTFGGVPGVGNTYTIKIKIGGSIFGTLILTSAGDITSLTKWWFESVITKHGGNILCNSFISSDLDPSVPLLYAPSDVDFVDLAFLLNVNRVILLTGTPSVAAINITQNYMILEYIKGK